MGGNERKEEQIKAYSSGLLSHYSGTGLSRPADWPPKERPHPLIRPPLFSLHSHISAWAQTRENLSPDSELSCPDLCIVALPRPTIKYKMGTYMEALLVVSYEMMLVDNGG